MNEQPEQDPRSIDPETFDYDAVAATLPTDHPERAADGLKALMQNPAFRQLVGQIQAGELNDDELRDEANSIALDLAARQELRRDEQ